MNLSSYFTQHPGKNASHGQWYTEWQLILSGKCYKNIFLESQTSIYLACILFVVFTKLIEKEMRLVKLFKY